MQIALACFFGQDYDQTPAIIQSSKGQIMNLKLAEAIVKNMEMAMEREFQTHLVFIPELLPFYLSTYDRELRNNANRVRDYIRVLIT